ncbi:response regulator transcription factor [Solirubrobacter ginsenosidimutans]|uniref:response regulator transcription factor n=1 Tax=Solirubrobacter ginsenosidimutans TaxID=490573 RepID=UPI0027E2A394|nr:response regulator transcription factor [Solirubrobacter ginsenosidimutans]
MDAPRPAAELPQHVLVIEDERKMASVLDRALGLAGFCVTAVGTGERGLAALNDAPYALVILDLLLPDVDGVAVLARAKAVAPEVPILVLSAVTDVRSKVVCLELGACDYVAKPCDLPELVARVRLRIRRPENGIGRRLTRGDHVLDRQRRVVHNGGGDVQLTTREFVLLEYLMEHSGDTCSRDELLEHVWGYTFDPGTNVVDVCVGRLRHKLGGDCLVTERNVGYRFVDA